MYGTFGVNRRGNALNLFPYSTTIYKIEIIIKNQGMKMLSTLYCGIIEIRGGRHIN